MVCSLLGSSVHGTFQAGILDSLAIPSTGDLPDPRIKPGFPALRADALPSEVHSSKPRRHGEYEVPMSTGFSVVTKSDHKVAAFLSAPLLGFFLFLVFIFCSSRVDFRCVCFKCTGTWFSYAWTYLYSLSGSFPILVLSVFSRLPCAISLFWIICLIISSEYVNPNLLMSSFPPTFTKKKKSKVSFLSLWACFCL